VRILCLTHSLSDVDGVGVYGTELLRRIAPRHESVRVLIARKHRGLSSRLPPQLDVEVALPPDYFARMAAPKFFASLVSSLPRVMAAARDVDLVHCLSDYPHALLGVRAARFAGKPVIVSGHGTYSVAPFHSRLHRPFIAYAYSRADAVLLGSRFALSRLAREIDLPRAAVCHYGVDPAPYAAAARCARPAGFERRYVVTIGELKERKGHHLSLPAFLRIADRHPDVDYVIIGNRPEGYGYYEERVAEVKRAGLESRVRMIGNVAEAEKQAILAHADVFMLTPVTAQDGGFEAFGLVFLEANACGVPTVGVADSGAEDAIRDGQTGLLAPKDDVDGIAQRLDRLLSDAALRATMGRNGVAFANELTWDRCADQLAELQQRLVAAKAKR
jgi:phosphatidylinositol alpha-1,6-mannosyltransferase